jgi:hypothetical protein
MIHYSIPNGAQYLTLHNSFSHPSFSYLLSCNSMHKTQVEIPNRWETTNSKTPGPIIMIRLPSAQLCCTIYQPQQTNCAQMLGRPNPFCCWAKLACFDTSSSSFNVQSSHIEHRWGWDALRLLIGPKQCCFYTSTYFSFGAVPKKKCVFEKLWFWDM